MRGEKGFTLIEVITIVAILGAIMGVVSMTIIMVMKISPQNNDWAVALRQVQNAGYWISRDVMMAQSVNVTTLEFLTLEWVILDDDGNSANCTVTYQFEDMSDGMKRLIRQKQVGDEPEEQILIAENIYYDPDGDPSNSTKVIDYESPTLTVKMTATCGETTVSRQYETTQRVPTSE